MKKTFLKSILIGSLSLLVANCSNPFLKGTCKATKEDPHKCCLDTCPVKAASPATANTVNQKESGN